MIDGDIYGPNVPIMLGLKTQLTTDGEKIVPAEQYGIQVVSMGFLTDDDAPVIWRGPMLHGVIQQFFRDVRWDELDYLIVDMPPGTGDVALSLSQTVPVAGAVVVTTPQTVSLADTRRAVRMYQKLNIPMLGLDREHEPLRLPELPARERHLRQGRRRDARRRAVGAVPRPNPDLRADSHRRRHRRADHDRRARLAGGRGLPRGCAAARGAAVDRQLQEECDSVDADRVNNMASGQWSMFGNRPKSSV